MEATNYERKVIYLSGKITGLHEEEVRKNFDDAAERYTEFETCTIIDPTQVRINLRKKLGKEPLLMEIMAENLKYVCLCDKLDVMPNWKDSEGAKIEHALAVYLGKEIDYLP
jgi:hypothetical protein